MLLGAEVALRLRASALPPPLKWANTNLDRKAQQIAWLSERGGASVVFIGSSAVNSSADPAGIRYPDDDRPVYNAAVRGGTPKIVSSWARHLVVPKLDPDIVVLGVASRELDANGPFLQDVEDQYFAAPAVRHLEGNETALQTAERRVESVSALFKYRTWVRDPGYLRVLVGMDEAPSVSAEAAGDPVAPNGRLSADFRPPRPYTTNFVSDRDPSLRISPAKRSSLRELLSYLERSVEHVIVVNMPVTEDYIDLQAEGQRELFDEILETEAERTGATYVDPGIWPRHLFRDPTHTNERGSQRLTTLLQATIDAL